MTYWPSFAKLGFTAYTLLVVTFTAFPVSAQQPKGQSAGPRSKPAPLRSGYLGVQVTSLTPELREFFGGKRDAGILVSRIEKGSPAEKGGIRVGDVIETADGQEVVSVFVLESIVNQKRSRDVLVVKVLRSKKSRVLKVTMEERERARIDLGEIFQWQWPPGGEMQLHQVDPHAFIHAMESFRAQFSEPMVLTRMQEMQRLVNREKTLELRIKKLESRILQLESKLRE